MEGATVSRRDEERRCPKCGRSLNEAEPVCGGCGKELIEIISIYDERTRSLTAR